MRFSREEVDRPYMCKGVTDTRRRARVGRIHDRVNCRGGCNDGDGGKDGAVNDALESEMRVVIMVQSRHNNRRVCNTSERPSEENCDTGQQWHEGEVLGIKDGEGCAQQKKRGGGGSGKQRYLMAEHARGRGQESYRKVTIDHMVPISVDFVHLAALPKENGGCKRLYRSGKRGQRETAHEPKTCGRRHPGNKSASDTEQHSVHAGVQPRSQSVLWRVFPRLLATRKREVVDSFPKVEGLVAIADRGAVCGEKARDEEGKKYGEEKVQD